MTGDMDEGPTERVSDTDSAWPVYPSELEARQPPSPSVLSRQGPGCGSKEGLWAMSVTTPVVKVTPEP